MYLDYCKLMLIFITVVFPIQIKAQVSEKDTLGDINTVKNEIDPMQNSPDTVSVLRISPFIEIGGKAFFTLNVDFRKKENYAISIGFQPFEGLLPNIMYYHFSGKRHRIEIGGGFSLGFTQELNPAIVLIHGVIGYRYQKKKGLFFRAGFTPLYVKFFEENENSNKFYPLPGLSLGYCF